MEVDHDGMFHKNALHQAAWKGDLETISLLSETGKSFGLDLVNTISEGVGNYGKTLIFYSITQCRDDSVRLLLSIEVNLLVVNHKGQTPSSLAGRDWHEKRRLFQVNNKINIIFHLKSTNGLRLCLFLLLLIKVKKISSKMFLLIYVLMRFIIDHYTALRRENHDRLNF